MNEQKTYQIPEGNLYELCNRIAKLNKRAAKLGVTPIEIRKTGNMSENVRKDDITGLIVAVTRVIEIELTGEAPKFAGWTLAATLEHTPEGNIIRTVPGITVNLMPFKDCAPHCEHCNLARRRRDTYLVAHDTGSVKQVGHDCIHDFLGHQSPQTLAALAEIWMSAGELCGLGEEGFGGGSGGGSDRLPVQTFLGYVARAVRQFGYVSGKAQREAEESGSYRQSTKNLVLSWMIRPDRGSKAYREIQERCCLEGETWPMPSDEDYATAELACQYVQDTLENKAELNEFENNLLVCSKLESIEFRTCGIAAYIVEYQRRDVQRAKEQAEKAAQFNNTHFGVVGTRYKDIKLTFLGTKSFDSQWGVCYYHTFSNEAGQQLLWKTGTSLGYADGFQTTAKFTVKAHSQFRGAAQTEIIRLVD